MSEAQEYLAQERRTDSIVVGTRHRTDLGDLTPLTESITRVGLLQPITVTPDGALVCGRRRLEAIRHLGWTSVRVWVRSGISDRLSGLLAQQDENALHKPLSPIEAAGLYRELKKVLSDDARRRQEASRFGDSGHDGAENGGGESPPPRSDASRSRARAALLVTGSDSSQRLEQIGRIQAVVDDAMQPLDVRRLAEEALDRINAGAPVDPSHRAVMRAVEQGSAERHDDPDAPAEPVEPTPTPEEIAALSDEVFARAQKERTRRIEQLSSHRAPAAPIRRSTKALVLTWADLDGWTEHHDAAEVAATLTDADWAQFERVVIETVEFADAVRAARQSRDPGAA